jgi:phosphoglucomutase
MRILFEDGSRVVFRLSGTGTEGATLRVYLERFSTKYDQDVAQMVAPLDRALLDFLGLKQRFHREEPDVVT